MERKTTKMIADNETNTLYLSSLLKDWYPKFYHRFKKVLDDCNLPVELLQNTKDIWAKDYMPVQVNNEVFVRFKYDPDYLLPEPFPFFRTDSKLAFDPIGLDYRVSDINLDGGNVVRFNNKAIMCDKVFEANEKKNGDSELIKNLKELFEVDELIFLPWENKKDYLGHADGIARFIDDKHVFINGYKDKHQELVVKALNDANLECIPLTCGATNNYESANGYYINYLQMEQAVFMPTFNNKNDEKALRQLEDAFKTVKTVESIDVSEQGGVLNCISWNVLN